MASSNSHKGKATANTNRTWFFVVVSLVSLFLLLSKLVSLAYKNCPSLRLYEEVDCLIESSGGSVVISIPTSTGPPAVQQVQLIRFIVYVDGTVYIHGRVDNTECSQHSAVGLLLNPLRSPQ